jgi:zinc-ribbon domain
MPPQPDRRRPANPEVEVRPTRQLQPDDRICGNCGEGNPPTRKFCSRCGSSLATAAVVPTPWWQKLRKLFELRLRPLGSRPNRRFRGLSSISRMIRRALAAAAVIAVLAYAVFPPLRGAVNDGVLGIRDKIMAMFTQQYVPVHPISTTATAELPDHPAKLATDTFKNTYWVAPDAAAQPTLILGFDGPTKLVRAIVHSGGGPDLEALGRPDKLHLVFSDGQRVLGTSDVTLTDTLDPQQVDFSGGDGATRVEVHVLSTYRSVTTPAVALSELELFQRQ